jgi:peroxiredoxin Q/BCP
MGREYMGVIRSTFVIDKQSNIVMVMEKVKTKTHHEDLLDWIKNNLNS